MQTIPSFKRGTRIEYTYAAGAVTPGKVVRTYSAKEIERHARSHGEKAAADLPNWIVCELTDANGTYKGACHVSQLRTIGNTPAGSCGSPEKVRAWLAESA